eukprot:gene66-75_t
MEISRCLPIFEIFLEETRKNTSIQASLILGGIMMLTFLLNIEIKDKSGSTPLMVAVYCGYKDLVTTLLQLGADQHLVDNNGSSTLTIASQYGHIDMVTLLLGHEADPNISTHELWTPLMLAAQFGHETVSKLLLDKGADPFLLNKDGFSPLLISSQYGYKDIVRLYLDRGDMDVNSTAKDGKTPLIVAATSNSHLAVLTMLLHKGAAVNAADNVTIAIYDTITNAFIDAITTT